MGCGCGKKTQTHAVSSVQITTAEVMSQTLNGEDFILVEYLGPSYEHLIPSPTGIIAKFGLRNYGIGKRGAQVKVHKDDAQNSSLFAIIPNKIVEHAEALSVKNILTNEKIVVQEQNDSIIDKEDELVDDFVDEENKLSDNFVVAQNNDNADANLEEVKPKRTYKRKVVQSEEE